MNLLIFTQAVDVDDPVLGFFHGWLEAFAPQFAEISVVCLKEGRHTLPANVRVYSLGKERGRSRSKYVFYFFRYIWSLRYNAVFVHMNEEYVMLGGWWWRLCGKKIVLWRNFKTGSWMTPLACRLANSLCYVSPESYTARFTHGVKMPAGIDTRLFVPPQSPATPGSLLFLGRLDEIKRPDLFCAALEQLSSRGVNYEAHIYGDPTPGNEEYAEALAYRYRGFSGASFLPGVPNVETPDLYRAHAIYVNLTPSGSFDKTIFEAMASGCTIVCANSGLLDVLPSEFIVSLESAAVARGLQAAIAMNVKERAELSESCRAYVEREHSLKLLAEKLAEIFGARRKIKVVFGINDLGIGGAERLTVEDQRIDQTRFGCYLITLRQNPEENFLAEVPSSVRTLHFDFKSLHDIRSWWRLYRALQALKPDIVVSNLTFQQYRN